MASSQINLDVNIKPHLTELESITKKAEKGGAFKGPGGSEALNRLQGYFTTLEKLFQKGSVSEEEFKIIQDVFKNIFTTLEQFAAKASKVSKKILEINQNLSAKSNQLDSRQGDLNTLKERKAAAISKINDKQNEGYSFYKMKKDHTFSNIKITDPDAILRNKSKGTLGIKTPQGDLTTAQDIEKATDEIFADYRSIVSDIIDTESDIKTLKEEIKALKEDLKNNSGQGKKNLDLISPTIDAKTQINESLNKTKTEISNEKQAAALAANPVIQNDRSTSSLGRAFKQFTLYNIALRGLKTAVREAIDTINKLDKSLTEQAMVTGLTRKQTYKLVESYQELAKATGATTKEIAGVATEYMKQGKSINESLILTKAAVSAAKVARVSVEDSVNYLTTALNGFQLAAEDAMLVSDKFAAVAAASATDYDELAIALSKVASQAKLAGMSIDYTTALLTKGLETTREAPETMGTALKTIIARMRELSDYGKTLDDGMDINNVESQLAYVDIALRNNQGELRSTEEVLDELGKKWDTLSTNQQAAVAKALAGTRQQSRLIAMMSDYERVTELQEIAQRSAGATSSQAGTYLEGMEASLNNVKVAWESIVTSITDSEVIIQGINILAKGMEFVNRIISTGPGMVAVVSVLATMTAGIVTKKIVEYKYQKLALKAQLKENRASLESLKTEKEKLIIKQKEKLLNEKDPIARKRINSEILSMQKDLLAINGSILENSWDQVSAQGVLYTIWQSILGIQHLYQLIQARRTASKAGELGLEKSITKEKMKQAGIDQANEGLNKTTAGLKIAGSAALNGPHGWIIALSILAALGIAVAGIAIHQSNYNKTAEGTSKRINKLSNEIFKLNQKSQELSEIISSFEAIDGKIVKTNKDLKEMNSLLSKAADKLDDEKKEDKYGNKTEKEFYNTLRSDRKKADFIKKVRQDSNNKARESFKKQLAMINGLSSSEKAIWLNDNTSNEEILASQDAVYGGINQIAYDKIDAITNLTKEEAKAVRVLTENLLSELSVKEALNYANNPEQIQSILKLLSSENASILGSDDYSLSEQVKAFKEIQSSLTQFPSALNAFNQAYLQYNTLSNLNQDALTLMDTLHLTAEDLNELQKSLSTLHKVGIDMSQDEFDNKLLNEILPGLHQSNGNIKAVIKDVFDQYLVNVENYEEAFDAIVNSLGKVLSIGMLNMGQHIESFGNRINTIYKSASDWMSLSESKKAEFMQDNADLFEGEDGAKLYEAFKTGDYNEINRALMNNETLQKKKEQQLREIDTELAIEEARTQGKRNEAYIKYLKEWKDKISNSTEIFKADMELLVEQENKQLEIYKDYLSKQQELFTKSLEKKKEAYNKYFDSIGEQQEDEKYLEDSLKLQSNLAKLSSSTDAKSQAQKANLEEQLAKLERERLETLRKRGQEAIMKSLDDEVSSINDKFDKLLKNEEGLLELMKADIAGGSFIQNVTGLKAATGGLSNLKYRDWLQNFSTIFSPYFKDANWDEVAAQQVNNQSFNFNMNGQNMSLDINQEDSSALWDVLKTILIKNGYR